MRLVDTSAWVEWLADSETGRIVRPMLPPPESWLTPSIIQFELAKWLNRERDEDTADRVIAFTRTCLVAELDTAIALAAADLSASHKLPMADAIVYATALAYDADLLTCDRHFQGLASVVFIPKMNA